MKTIPSTSLTEIIALLLAAILVGCALVGCGEKAGSSSGPALSAKPRQGASATMEPILAAWQQGDQAAAVTRFWEADWSQRPLFAPGTTLSLSEAQFKALPAASREANSPEMMTQVGELKKLAEAVAHAGRDAAARKDLAQAHKHFTALKQFGEALDRPECLTIVRLTGQAIRKKADTEFDSLGH